MNKYRLSKLYAYGSYYYLGSYENSIKDAGWSPNNRIIHYFNKPVSKPGLGRFDPGTELSEKIHAYSWG